MNIAQVCHPGLGGSGRLAVRLAQALAGAGHRVSLVSTAAPAALPGGHQLDVRAAPPPTHPVFSHDPVTVSVAGALVELARERPVDVIHAHFAVPWACSAALACDALGDRAPAVVVTLHGSDVFGIGAHPLYASATRAALGRASAITAVSSALRDAARSELGLGGAVEVVPNFVRTAEVPLASPRAGRPPVLAHASNFRPVKRPLEVVEIFARVRALTPAKLRLIGAGPELARARRRAAELGVESDLELTGDVRDIVPELADVAVFLAPSERESFGLAALEAQAAGIPVVGSAVDGLPEVIEHGITGLLHPVGDTAAMAASALRLVDDIDERAHMAAAAARRARENFDEDRAVGSYLAAYARAREIRRRLPSPAA